MGDMKSTVVMLRDVSVIVIAIFLILAYFGGWG